MNSQQNENGPERRGNDATGPGQPPSREAVIVTEHSIHTGTDNAADPCPCEHHWVASHRPGLKIWVVQCSMCRAFDAADMQQQIDALITAALAQAVA